MDPVVNINIKILSAICMKHLVLSVNLTNNKTSNIMFLLSVTIKILVSSLSFLSNPSILTNNHSPLWNCDFVVIASEGIAGVHP